MPFQVKLASPIGGVAANSVQTGPQGGQVGLIAAEFSHIGHGLTFLNRLESVCSFFFDHIPEDSRVIPSSWDHMLAIVHANGNAAIYINELAIEFDIITKHGVVAGPIDFLNDIAAIARVRIPNVEIPADAGVVFFFSIGWNKGLFFDLSPMNLPYELRDYDIWEVLAFYFDQMRLQECWKLTEDDWAMMYKAGWFPFIGLKYQHTKLLIDGIRNGFDLTDITSKINDDLIGQLPERMEFWKKNIFFEGHIEPIERAIQHHLNGDYFSSTTILYLRIEGIMKAYHKAVDTSGSGGQQQRTGQKAIRTTATTNLNHSENVKLSFMAPRLTQFLEDVFFGKTEKGNAELEDVSRNSVSHGTADFDKHSLTTSLLGLLIVDQFAYLMRPKAPTAEPAEAFRPEEVKPEEVPKPEETG